MALKIPDSKLAESAKFVTRFKQEAKAMALLHHRNIVQVYSVGEYNGLPYLAMEFAKGPSLSDIIAEWGSLAVEEAVEYMLQILDAVDCAHQSDVIHRDLKPGNILVESSGRLLVADFGISKILSNDNSEDTLTFVGTPIYMSPEQCGEGSLDKRTDIYSLGIIFYEMLVGKPPFDGASPAEIIKSHLLETPSFPGEMESELPARIVKIIRKMLAKDPEQRYPATHALIHDLKRWQKDSKTGTSTRRKKETGDASAPLVLCHVTQKIMVGAVMSALKNIEHRIDFVENAKQLISKVSREKPKIVILCHEQGKSSVFNVAKKIKEFNGNSETKMVLLSHGISRADVEKAFAAGVSDIIAEPFDPSVLVSKLESALMGMQRSIESRRFFRKEVSGKITMRIENQIVDISEGGMRIATNMALKIGEILRFELRLFKELGLGEKAGRIVWISKNEAEDDLSFHAGLDFVDFTREERDTLRKWIFDSEIAGRIPQKFINNEPNMGPVLKRDSHF